MGLPLGYSSSGKNIIVRFFFLTGFAAAFRRDLPVWLEPARPAAARHPTAGGAPHRPALRWRSRGEQGFPRSAGVKIGAERQLCPTKGGGLKRGNIGAPRQQRPTKGGGDHESSNVKRMDSRTLSELKRGNIGAPRQQRPTGGGGGLKRRNIRAPRQPRENRSGPRAVEEANRSGQRPTKLTPG